MLVTPKPPSLDLAEIWYSEIFSVPCFREQSLSIGETGAEGNELGYETIAFAVNGV